MAHESTDRPHYDSRCLTEQQWLETRRLYTIGGWEWKFVPAEKRVYLRRYLSGPVSTETEGWINQ
jgi:hypothetical protein